MMRNLPIMAFKSANELRKWLIINHTTSKGMWLRIYKKNSCVDSVTFEEVLLKDLFEIYVNFRAKNGLYDLKIFLF